tara:strand:+ start:231 stop:1118 length:888 start_codon:yes stop_codon:yes gene_type:complete
VQQIVSVAAIPPSYDENQALEIRSTQEYIKYLEKGGCHSVMTTAGTSQFNLLDINEIHRLNKCIAENFNKNNILGIPPLSNMHVQSFVEHANTYKTENSQFMALYPDRFYNKQLIEDYAKCICDIVQQPIYFHCLKMRSGIAGDWNYDTDTVNRLFDLGLLIGIKEEIANLSDSYNFMKGLHPDIHTIVAGGSMRRFCFLESAGANSFLSGIGNLFPDIENEFIDSASTKERNDILKVEQKFFNVFMKYGWHISLRASLKILNLTCFHNRNPWPMPNNEIVQSITSLLENITNER